MLKRFYQSRLFGQWLLAVGLAAVLVQIQSRAAAVDQDQLHFAGGFLITGNYVVGSVDLTPLLNPPDPVTGLATGTIHMSGVPQDAQGAPADIVAAYLYWESIYDPVSIEPTAGVKFRGMPVDPQLVFNPAQSPTPMPPGLKASTLTSLPGNTATCWSSIGATGRLTMFRADVLHLLPKLFDANGDWTGKRLVNDSDLTTNVDLNGNAYALHAVTLPESAGNHAVDSGGATLVVVYRNPAEPLTKIILYDGAYAQAQGNTTAQTLRGFYQHAGNAAKMTHIVGNGVSNGKTRLFFNGTQVSAAGVTPFPGTSPSSDRSWNSPTFSPLAMGGTTIADGYGETVTTSVDHTNSSPYDCLTWAAVIFSTPVLDADNDGLPDALEASSTSGALPWKDPNDRPLPDLYSMGARPTHKDLFVEINAMKTDNVNFPTPYTDHNHMPSPDVLMMVGDAYKNGTVANPDSMPGIKAHFDVGDITAYHNQYPCDAVNHPEWCGSDVDQYLVPSTFARGGESITEVACESCQFPDYPGTVDWKYGLEVYRDSGVGDDGRQLAASEFAGWVAGTGPDATTHRRRFDFNRRNLFHYALYAHARGNPKSPDPCLDANDTPTGFDNSGQCAVTENPDFHVPTSASGVADLPGGNVLITLGLWDNFVGKPFVQASTTLHELGHNLELWHGGRPATLGRKSLGTVTYFEPNCKPNYLSSMSYLFQVHGLQDNDGNLHLDYSHIAHPNLNEQSLFDGQLDLTNTPLYRPSWFAPISSPIAAIIGAPAKRFCNGAQFNPPYPTTAPWMARIDAASTSAAIDWDENPATPSNATPPGLNVNFDGTAAGAEVFSAVLYGVDDWSGVRLNQIGAANSAAIFSTGTGIALDASGGVVLDSTGGIALDATGGVVLDSTGGIVLDSSGGIALDATGGIVLDSSGGIALDATGGVVLDSTGGVVLDSTGGIALDATGGIALDATGGVVLDSTGGISDLKFESAKEMGRSAPHALKACVIGSDPGCSDADPTHNHRVALRWKEPTFGHAVLYHVYRVKGDAVDTTTIGSKVEAGTTAGTSLVDTAELPNGIRFTYFATADFDDPSGSSGASNYETITAINDAPVAIADSYTAREDTLLAGNNVLDNDTDDDSAHAGLRAVLVSGPGPVTMNPDGSFTSAGLTMQANGSFTYMPPVDFEGTVVFTYRANDGVWTDGTTPMSPNSASQSLSITVIPRHTTTTLSSSANPAGFKAPVTFTATVASTMPAAWAPLVPTGTVTFKDGATTIGTGVLDATGHATFTTSTLAKGTHSITAVYCGPTGTFCSPSTVFYGSTSSVLVQTVSNK